MLQTTSVIITPRPGIKIKMISNQIVIVNPVEVLEIKIEDPAEMVIEAALINSKNAAMIVARADTAEMMIKAVLINSKNAVVIVARVDTVEMMTEVDSEETMTEADTAEMMIEVVLINSKNAAMIVALADTVEMVIEVDLDEIMTEADIVETMTKAALINSKNAAMIVARADTAEIMTEADSDEIMTEVDSDEIMTEADTAEIMTEADLDEIMTEADTAEMMIKAVLINSKNAAMIVARADMAEMMIEVDSEEIMIVVVLEEVVAVLVQVVALSVVVQDTRIGIGLVKVPADRVAEAEDLVEMTNDVERKNRASVLTEGRHKGTYLVRSDGRMNLATENLVPGNTVYNERLVVKKGIEYRTWDPFRSKLAASIKNGLETFPFKRGSSVLYLGVSSGTTASHISDIVGVKGMMFCVEHASRVARDFLDRVASHRKNIVPVLQDARRPREYSAVYGKVDIVYADIAQPDQTQIVLENCQMYLKDGGVMFLVIKTRSIDVIKTPRQVINEEKEKISRSMDVLELIDLMPYDKDHAMIVAH